MQIKNNIIKIIIFFFSLLIFEINLSAEEFNISANEISIDNQNDVVTGKGNVAVLDSEGNKIKSENVIYEKKREYITIEDDVEILDIEGNLLKTTKATYDKINELIVTYGNSELLFGTYKLISENIFYDRSKKIISSNKKSIFSDQDGNVVYVDMFQYNVEKNLFSSIGKIKIIDQNKNKYFFKELHVDTKKKEMIGSEASVILDEENFGLSKENDPRFVANDIFISKDQSKLSKAVFTVCKIRKDKCPPWSLQANEINHDKIKKTIYYKSATLKVYDIPIFYFPRFFHPDPTVKRQSGFLNPFFTNTTSLGFGFGTPYYWAISQNKDMTITPKFYGSENMLFLNEYRQAFENGFLTLDTSYTQGYSDTSETKTGGSRNHIFAKIDFDLAKEKPYSSNLSMKIQKTSNDTFFRVHDINTALVNSQNTDLENSINYKFSKDNMFVDISATVYENLTNKTNDRYEYILPNIMYGKTFFTEKFGTLDFKSNALYRNYEGNKYTTLLTNDIVWNPFDRITKMGFVNTLRGEIKNTNYEARNTTSYKTDGTINEIAGVMSYKSSLPMKKEGTFFSKIFTPNFMIRYAPGHMRNLSDESIVLKYSNLYSTNKTSVIEKGLSAILGFEYLINQKDKNGAETEKIKLSLGQIYSAEENKDLPNNSSLDQKTSDLVGEFEYNFSKIGKIDYKFALDHNFNNFNYNQISTNLNFGKIDFNIDYLEERNHIGSEHYINSGVSLNINSSNKISFETKKNFKTESTELYNLSYQYINDCLKAGLVFRREFYQDADSDIEPKDSLMFMITFTPFGKVNTPAINP